MVLDHCGSPLLIGPDAKPREHVFADWKKSMTALAKLPNVNIKTGGLGMQFTGDQSFDRPVKATTKELVPVWKPYIETCIELFTTAGSSGRSNSLHRSPTRCPA
jgi:predicted TIM-barrel fold metal-dependent hydrolase